MLPRVQQGMQECGTAVDVQQATISVHPHLRRRWQRRGECEERAGYRAIALHPSWVGRRSLRESPDDVLCASQRSVSLLCHSNTEGLDTHPELRGIRCEAAELREEGEVGYDGRTRVVNQQHIPATALPPQITQSALHPWRWNPRPALCMNHAGDREGSTGGRYSLCACPQAGCMNQAGDREGRAERRLKAGEAGRVPRPGHRGLLGIPQSRSSAPSCL